jgi:hypothetical protein
MDKGKYNEATELLRKMENIEKRINYLDARLNEEKSDKSNQYDHWLEGVYYALFEQDLDLSEEDFIVEVVKDIKANYEFELKQLQEQFKRL